MLHIILLYCYAAYDMHYISWILYQVYLCILMGQVMCFGMNLILKAKSTARDSHKHLVTVPFHSGLVQYLYLSLVQHSHHTYTNEACLRISGKSFDLRVGIFEPRASVQSQNIHRIRHWNYLPRRVKILVSKYFETDFNFWAMKIYQSPNEFISSISPYKITRLFNRTVSCVFWCNHY